MAPPSQPPQVLGYVPLASLREDTVFRLRDPGEVASLAQSIAQVGQLFAIEVRTIDGKVEPITGFRRLKALRLLHRSRVLVRDHGEISDAAAALIAAADAIDSRALEVEELQGLLDRYQAMGWSTPALDELLGRAIERARERLEDLAAIAQGLEPPDRTVLDEDALDDDEPRAVPSSETRQRPGSVSEASTSQAPDPVVEIPAAEAALQPAADVASLPDLEFAAAEAAATPEPVALQRPPEEAPLPMALGRVRIVPADDLAPPPRQEVTADWLARDLAVRFSELTQDLSVLVDHWTELPEGPRGVLADQLDYYGALGQWLGRTAERKT
ncbi:ParB/RepB/Spo0J family partition protein [Vulgatibacter incomptus]|uniref:ParB-like nuclease domain protein n=1 Tax=Vulgatibacter incomptus TaxID=1391653 RepID=A0A0K1PBV0_9BACT|nr:ParB/RepB/Spo0J family partition protein [Vulgatibacter incomptus]AKU90881.1 ParB-like nuclease domain protein [Vulgatibacter incomptus]